MVGGAERGPQCGRLDMRLEQQRLDHRGSRTLHVRRRSPANDGCRDVANPRAEPELRTCFAVTGNVTSVPGDVSSGD